MVLILPSTIQKRSNKKHSSFSEFLKYLLSVEGIDTTAIELSSIVCVVVRVVHSKSQG